jgi:hypothetical protein
MLAVAVVAACTAAPVVAPAWAQRVSPIDATRFLTLCTGRELAGCDAYIEGVADTIATYHDLSERPGSAVKVPPDVCIPARVTGVVLREKVVGWLREHESERGKPLHQLVYRALLAAYPCG